MLSVSFTIQALQVQKRTVFFRKSFFGKTFVTGILTLSTCQKPQSVLKFPENATHFSLKNTRKAKFFRLGLNWMLFVSTTLFNWIIWFFIFSSEYWQSGDSRYYPEFLKTGYENFRSRRKYASSCHQGLNHKRSTRSKPLLWIVVDSVPCIKKLRVRNLWELLSFLLQVSSQSPFVHVCFSVTIGSIHCI